jgi:RNA polymerase sigma factor (TIGR02999 family)
LTSGIPDIGAGHRVGEAGLGQGRAHASATHAVTDALHALHAGDAAALDRLAPLVYDDLRRIARRQLGGERPGHTLSPTALVHEAWLRLGDQQRAAWADRAQFFALAARMMRRVLVDHARRRHARRRGGTARAVTLDVLEEMPITAAHASSERAAELQALDEALERLALLEPRLVQVVEMRYFAGFTTAETAAALGVTTRTVERDWMKARGWLLEALRNDDA